MKDWEIIGFEVPSGTPVDEIDYHNLDQKVGTKCPKMAVPVFFIETMDDPDFENVNLYIIRNIQTSAPSAGDSNE